MARLGHGKQAQACGFASGYGRVSRHLRLPDNMTCCDIHADAVDFLRDKIGVKAIIFKTDPSDFQLEEKFNFSFVLSLFSHLPSDLFGRWLERLYSLLPTSRPPCSCSQRTGKPQRRRSPCSRSAWILETGFGFIQCTNKWIWTTQSMDRRSLYRHMFKRKFLLRRRELVG